MSDAEFAVFDEPPESSEKSDVPEEEFRPFAVDDSFQKEQSERRPEPHTPRKSTAELVTMAWGGIGMALVRSGTDIPVGKVLQFEAPLAGSKIDALIAGTWIDHVLQPLVGRLDSAQELGALIAFPLMVGMYERNPATGVIIEPLLREVISSVIVDMAPVLKKKKSTEKQAAKAMADIAAAFDIPAGTDPIDAILGSIFAPVETAQPSEETS